MERVMVRCSCGRKFGHLLGLDGNCPPVADETYRKVPREVKPMTEVTILVAPKTAEKALAARLTALAVDPATVSFIEFGLIPKGSISEWIGVSAPEGGDDLLVNLVAPDAEGRAPSLRWGYIRGARWSFDPGGATRCFNHSDLLAARIARPEQHSYVRGLLRAGEKP